MLSGQGGTLEAVLCRDRSWTQWSFPGPFHLGIFYDSVIEARSSNTRSGAPEPSSPIDKVNLTDCNKVKGSNRKKCLWLYFLLHNLRMLTFLLKYMVICVISDSLVTPIWCFLTLWASHIFMRRHIGHIFLYRNIVHPNNVLRNCDLVILWLFSYAEHFTSAQNIENSPEIRVPAYEKTMK